MLLTTTARIPFALIGVLITGKTPAADVRLTAKPPAELSKLSAWSPAGILSSTHCASCKSVGDWSSNTILPVAVSEDNRMPGNSGGGVTAEVGRTATAWGKGSSDWLCRPRRNSQTTPNSTRAEAETPKIFMSRTLMLVSNGRASVILVSNCGEVFDLGVPAGALEAGGVAATGGVGSGCSCSCCGVSGVGLVANESVAPEVKS